jgi:hypothetical protein
MLNKINAKSELIPFFTNNLLENDVGVIVDEAMPKESYVAIDIDRYYHHISPNPTTPPIADILLVAQRLSQKEQHHIYIVEMKNIISPHNFHVKNIYEKFMTAIEDFMKIKYADMFMDESYQVEKFRLFFVSDAYRLKKRGWTDGQIKSFLLGTKIMAFQKMPLFQYRNFKVLIEYQLPDPLLEWY